MIELEKYETFLADYQAFEAKHWSEKFETEKKGILNLAVGFKHLEQRLKKIVLEESPQYNIFKILNVRTYEVKLHTPFLVNLLNPKGSHGQGALFLDLFFEMVLKLDYRFSNIQNYKIVEELSTEDKGRIDIIMTFYDGKNRVGIVIENKIYAKDQPKQLERYYNYLVGQGLNDKTGKLYYLTPWKKHPNGFLEDDLLQDLSKRKVLHNIGYYAEIYPWLENCLSKIQSPKVKFTIEQYLKTIIRL